MGFENRFRHGSRRLGYRLGRNLEVPLCSGDQWRRRLFLIFVLFTVLLGYPLLVGEFIFGRRNQTNAIDAYKKKRREPLGFLQDGSA